MTLAVGVDAGRSWTKAMYELNGEKRQFTFPSRLVPYYDHGGDDVLKDPNDMIMEVFEEGQPSKKYFVGEVTEFVNFGTDGQLKDQDKDTDAFKMFVLNALYRVGAHEYEPVVVGTGVPYQMFKDQKDKIKAKIEGKHRIKITKRDLVEERIIDINQALITAEGYGVFVDNMTEDEVGIVELGSVTKNSLRIKKKRVMPAFSNTQTWGWDNLPNGISTPETVAEMVVGDMKGMKWETNMRILLAGGRMNELEPFIKRTYPNAILVPDPQFANVRGFHKIAKAKVKEMTPVIKAERRW